MTSLSRWHVRMRVAAGVALRREPDAAGAHGGDRLGMGVEGQAQRPQRTPLEPVVVVEEHHEPAARLEEAAVARGGQSPLLCRDEITVTRASSSVPSHSDVPSLEASSTMTSSSETPSLVEDARHAAFEPGAAIVSGDDDGHLGRRPSGRSWCVLRVDRGLVGLGGGRPSRARSRRLARRSRRPASPSAAQRSSRSRSRSPSSSRPSVACGRTVSRSRRDR